MAAIAWKISLGLLAWMAPVVLGLLLAGPVSWLTSRRAGPLARWSLATAEDRKPPPILIATETCALAWSDRIKSLTAEHLPERVAA